MSFGSHLLPMLALPKHGRVEVVYKGAPRVADMPDRKTLATMPETEVRRTHKLAE